MTDIERIMSKVSAEPMSGCWLWTGSRGGNRRMGYGATFLRGNNIRAHRAIWILVNGDIPRGMFVLHKCDTPCCINPSHLFLGTLRDNTQDMVKKGRAKGGGNPAGPDHPSRKLKGRYAGENHPQAKLSAMDVLDIRKRCSNGENQRSIAKIYGVTQSHISQIARHETWRNIA